MKIQRVTYETAVSINVLVSGLRKCPWLFTPSGSRVYAMSENADDYDFIVNPHVFPRGELFQMVLSFAGFEQKPTKVEELGWQPPPVAVGSSDGNLFDCAPVLAYDAANQPGRVWVDITDGTEPGNGKRDFPAGEEQQISQLVYLRSTNPNWPGTVNLIFARDSAEYGGWLCATKVLTDLKPKDRSTITVSKETRVLLFQTVRDLYIEKARTMMVGLRDQEAEQLRKQIHKYVSDHASKTSSPLCGFPE